MNILMVSSSLPYPPNDGERSTLLNLLKELAQRHRISILSFIDQPDLEKHKEEVEQYCDKVCTLLAEQECSSMKKVLYHLSMYPYSVVRKYSKAMEELVRKSIQTEHYDVVHFGGVGVLPYGLRIQTTPRVAFVHDAVALYYYRNMCAEKRLVKKGFYLIEYQKMKRYERTVYQMFDRCMVVSERDKAALQQHCANAKISVVPIGVDADYFSAAKGGEDFPSLLFSGNMDYPPNVHAVMWFEQRVLRLVKQKYPDIKFYIVGRNPSKELGYLRKDEHIIITGYVEDIRAYFDKATVFVCPMISGTGMKIKLLEAMSMGKAIVASTLSLEGIAAVKGRSCLVAADTAEEFYNGIVKVIEKKNYRKKLERMARKCVMENYRWKDSAELLENIYAEVVDNFMVNGRCGLGN